MKYPGADAKPAFARACSSCAGDTKGAARVRMLGSMVDPSKAGWGSVDAAKLKSQSVCCGWSDQLVMAAVVVWSSEPKRASKSSVWAGRER